MSKLRQPPRRRWWRFVTQFSLRTLLAVTTLAAVGCWWFLQPESRDEDLAGGRLKLRRQLKLQHVLQGVEAYPFQRSIGSWRVRGEHGDLLIDGRYADDLPHGKWTSYHANGRKAAQGQVFCGARTGLWRTWDEEGTLRSETTYKAVLRSERLPPPGPICYSLIPVVGMIDFLGQFGGGGLGGVGGFGGQAGGLGGPALPLQLPMWETTYVAVRHGPVNTWHDNGKLQLEGEFLDDRRDGLWTWYDEQGRITEQGSFKAGVRDGEWIDSRAAGLEATRTRYLSGLPAAEHAQFLARLGEQLSTGNISRKIAAAERLEELGPAGVDCLVQALESSDLETQLLALRALSRQQSLPAQAVALIEPLQVHPEPRIAIRARLALYRARPGDRQRLLAPLLAALRSAEDPLAIEALLAIYEFDPDRRLVVLPPLVERMAVPEAESRGSYVESAPGYIEQLADFGWDVIPQLDAVFPQASPQGRWFIVRVLNDLVGRSRPTIVESSTGIQELRREIPESGRDLLERATADPDPGVQQAVDLVRQSSEANFVPGSGGGFSAFGGQSGGFF